MKRYEAMFLFDSAAARDWATMEQEVRRLMGRIGADLLACVKFDERKLAYEIKRRKRGTYVLAYMDAAPEKIAEFERDAQLSEVILRVLVLRAENLTAERLAELQAHPADVALTPLGEGRRHDDGGDRRPPRGRGRMADVPDDEAPPLEGDNQGFAPARHDAPDEAASASARD